MRDPHPTCPNCAEPVIGHPNNECVLNALITVLRDRGGKTDKRLIKLHAGCHINALWDELGPIIDKLEAGDFKEYT